MAELLAPAGSFESLTAAVNAGADAVYMGGLLFGARAYAKNPDQEQLIQGIDYCHLHGRKFYLTVNTLLKENEIRDKLYEFLAPFYEAGLDGVIIQDPGVLAAIGEWFPDLPLHASTQMSVTSAKGAEFLKSQGVTRIVPARELSLDEVKDMIQKTGLEVETFVHGAMCFAYSGRCLFSSLLGGRSGNRGRCAQPCRLPYSICGDDISGKRGHLLSLKDMCALEFLPQLVKAGIASFKIEGRMKGPEYTAGVVSIYRKYLDLCGQGTENICVSEEDQRILLDLYNRGGFSRGYYEGKTGLSMMAMERPNHYGTRAAQLLQEKSKRERNAASKGRCRAKALEPLFRGDVLELRGASKDKLQEFTLGKDIREGEIFQTPFSPQIRNEEYLYRTKCQVLKDEIWKKFCKDQIKEKIKGELRILPDSPVILNLSFNQWQVREEGGYPQEAQNTPLSEEGVRRQFLRTGNTPFVFENLEISLGDHLFLPVQAQNDLRRRALESLEDKILDSARRKPCVKKELPKSQKKTSGTEPALNVSVSSSEQLEAVFSCMEEGDIKISDVYLDPILILQGREGEEYLHRLIGMMERIHQRGAGCFLVFPPVFRKGAVSFFERAAAQGLLDQAEGCVVFSMDELGFLRNIQYKKEIVSDGGLYAFNSMAMAFYRENGVSRITLSPELNAKELEKIAGPQCELVIYGHQPLMVTAQCLRKNMRKCSGRTGFLELKDRKNVSFPVLNRCGECTNVIYNSVPLQLGGCARELRRLPVACFRLEFTVEGKEETYRILREYGQKSFWSEESKGKEVYAGTRGHFKRGVE